MKGEPAQAAYQDIRRLLALGFPGQSGDLLEVVGRDAFLAALADPALRIRVLDQQPRTLDEALAAVVRMEAYGSSSVAEDDKRMINVFVLSHRLGRLRRTDVFVS